jgi:hypothetical protein
MTWLARELGISLGAVLAIGDGVNDVSMLKVAGVGVAMAGAPRVVLQAAGYQTASNEHDGVALALNRFIFNDLHEPQRDEEGA